MKLKKITFILFIFIFLLFNLSLIIGINNTENSIDNYFRIHIVANSDSIDDQILKLNIAKEVDKYISDLTKNANSKNEYIESITENISNILNVAQEIINENNYNYSVTGYIGKLKYDEKIKDGLVMKEGIYDSLKIVIGDGNGENWWSLLFPHSIEGVTTSDAISSNDITYSSGIATFFANLFNTELKTN